MCPFLDNSGIVPDLIPVEKSEVRPHESLRAQACLFPGLKPLTMHTHLADAKPRLFCHSRSLGGEEQSLFMTVATAAP